MQAHLRRNLASYPLQAVEVRVRVRNHHERETLTLTMDEPTAALVMFAVRALMIGYQAHAREVRLDGETLQPDTWGRKNREDIASGLERHIAGCRRSMTPTEKGEMRVLGDVNIRR